MLADNKKKFKMTFNAFIILILCILCGFGMFSFITSLGFSKTISMGVSFVFFIGVLSLLFIIKVLKNKPNGKKHINKLIITICLIVVLANIGLIAISPYFTPHNTTTANNRYYIKTFKYTYFLDNYLQDKTVYVSKDSIFINEDTKEVTHHDKSNQLALFSSAKSVEVLDEIEPATYEQIQYILSLEGQFEAAQQNYAKTENAIFYTGSDFDSFDEVVILEDINFDTYFMPYDFYKTIKNMR